MMLVDTIYGFEKIGRRKWREIGFWSKTQIVNALRLKMALARKYPNARFEIAEAKTACDIPIHDKEDNLTIYVTFKNNADEAEFMMKESS